MSVDPLASYARAKRAHEHLQLYNVVHGPEGFNQWLAISLADGSCDQRPYTSKREAIRFQKREDECVYLFFTGMPLQNELRFFLDACEELYDNGYALADPDDYVNPEVML